MLISNSNEKKTALARFVDYTRPLKKIVSSNTKKYGAQQPETKNNNLPWNFLWTLPYQ